MTDQRRVKRNIRRLQRIKTWQLVLLLLLSALLTATFLRLNNIGMIERRTAVLMADKTGDQEVIRSRLYDLQRYSADHMNASSGAFYLEEQYKRDTAKAIKKASASQGGNNINVQADRVCKQQFSGYSQAYVQCFAAELAKYPSGLNSPDKANLPNAALYRHEFSSPAWSPDFAGFMVAITLLIAVLIVVRIISLLILRALVHRHYSSI